MITDQIVTISLLAITIAFITYSKIDMYRMKRRFRGYIK